MTDILYVTRPLTPPWDEASKIFAYNLATHLQTETIHIMTSALLNGLPNTVIQHPIYRSKKVREFGLCEKIRSLAFQRNARNTFPITHYFFTPARLNAWTIQHLIGGKTVKIQTVATLREDLYSSSDLAKTIFGDYIVTYTKKSQKKLISMGFKNVRTIFPGIEFSRFFPSEKNMSLLRDLELSENDFIVSHPGEYVRLGATDMLVKTLLHYFKTYKNSSMKFIFANRIKNKKDAQKKQSVLRILEQAGISNFIRFTDTISDMPGLYNISDIIVFPVGNLYGKFDIPLVIPEAQACAKPVILSDLEQFSEFTSPDNSIIVKRNGSIDLAHAIETLRINKDYRLRLGNNARVFALKTFSIEHVAKEYEFLYASIQKTMLQ